MILDASRFHLRVIDVLEIPSQQELAPVYRRRGDMKCVGFSLSRKRPWIDQSFR
jgi:hypothetical protein